MVLMRDQVLHPVTVIWTTPVEGLIFIQSPGGNVYFNSIQIVPGLTAGTITSGLSQNIIYNTIPATIVCALATGGPCTTPNYVYQWQQSPDNINFVDLPGTTSQNLAFSTGQTATNYYRRFVTETTTNNTGYSNTASVIIIPPNPVLPLVAGSINPATQYINYDNSSKLSCTGVGGGTYAYSYQWQSSPDNNTWTNVSCKNTVYSPPNLTSTTYFRVAVTSNSTGL